MTNNHYQKNHSSGGASKGFYIALGVCLIAIGVAAWTAAPTSGSCPERNSIISLTKSASTFLSWFSGF